MSLAADDDVSYRWSVETFVQAWDAGVFGKRVELVEGELLTVPIGGWHGRTIARVTRRLPEAPGCEVTSESLLTAGSLPDPDCWVRRTGVPASGVVGLRLSAWPAAAVALVVEVADETRDQDLGVKARLYASGGYERYWAVTREGVYEHTLPGELGYASRILRGRGEKVALGYAPGDVAVEDLLAPE